ncbi:MAG: NAD-dependent epimerase/dehydratase family protein [Pseudomonadota bacterium]
MKVLVVGGTGLIGGDIALQLQKLGHEVTIMSRKPSTVPMLAALPFMQGDYVNDDFSGDQLSAFDTLVFAAAADIRYMPQDGSMTEEEFYTSSNDIPVPRFFATAKAAGVERAVYISTFYPIVARDQVGKSAYVTSRYNTEKAVCALSDESFSVCSLNPGFVWGHIEGLDVPHISAYISFLKGELPDIPVFAPPGGSNHITSRSLAQATANLLERGEGGKSYLIGDENHTWQDFIAMGLEMAGRPQEVPIGDGAQHPFFPDVIMFAGAGKTVSYEPDDEATLAFDRQQMGPLIEALLKA